ncbi:MAG: UDP-2,3-diacylglucosamine diphosphatase LpxI [Paracoccaceae bacterium]|nr:UDP-2,3-diacylglucosamine diphosphatase LpxI [Paracoccaceae bacterium]
MLALIAGQGALPEHIVDALPDRPHIAALDGFLPDRIEPDQTFRIEHLGSFLTGLGERGVTQVCFAGAIRRPTIDQALIDAETQLLVPQIAAAMVQGDDAVLRVVLDIFETAGFTICAAHDLVPGLLPEAGVLTAQQPDERTASEVARADAFLAAMGAADLGQACVVHRGQALAVEAIFGTDWMLESLAARPDGRGGILYKAPKLGQDRRIDLPAIGPETVRNAARAGLDGIVIEAGGVMVLDAATCIKAADDTGLFLWVRAP